ncbi:MAG: hypothetical protein QOI60_1021, partial [Actinomycetota bacterium]|nr:hypothetical protein [Actinomycetota bacterium]
LRIIDVPAALQARAYAAPVSLVIEVDDVFCPWNAGRHRLIVDATGAATVDPTDDSADLSCSAGDLGAVFLGGTPFRRLRRAGQVAEHTPGSLAAADAAFGWDPAPWSSILF